MGRRRNAVYAPAEADIQAAVIEHWRTLGLQGTFVAAIPNARAFGQAGLTRGLFDLIVLTPRLAPATGFIELKADGGVLSTEQKAFKGRLIRLGVPYAVTYGRDEPIRVLEEWGAVRPTARAAA